jgi:hypothetical protein
MKYLKHIFFSIFISTSLFASDYNYNIQGIGTAITKSMTLDNSTKFLLYENNIGWTDNLGNYGKSFCFGRIKIVNEVADKFNLICESIDQNGDKNWAEFSRSDTNMDAGAGSSIYIDGTGIYREFIGAKCIFSTKYLEDNLFFKTKCKVNPEIIKNLARK